MAPSRTQRTYLAKYDELITAILACPTVAGFCYTQLTDTGQETNGLLTGGTRAQARSCGGAGDHTLAVGVRTR